MRPAKPKHRRRDAGTYPSSCRTERASADIRPPPAQLQVTVEKTVHHEIDGEPEPSDACTSRGAREEGIIDIGSPTKPPAAAGSVYFAE